MCARAAAVAIVVCGTILGLAVPASAQKLADANVELSMLGGVSIFFADGETATNIGIPTTGANITSPVGTAVQATFWTGSALIVQAGGGLNHYSEDNFNFTIIQVEGGVGGNLASPDRKTVPFLLGLVGLLSVSGEGEGESSAYIGGQAGMRHFFKEYAAFRVQATYRHLLDDAFDLSALEFGAGLSFVL